MRREEQTPNLCPSLDRRREPCTTASTTSTRRQGQRGQWALWCHQMRLSLVIVGGWLFLQSLAEPPPGLPNKGGQPSCWYNKQWMPYEENDEPWRPKPFPPRTDSWKKPDTSIMISISSFRDYRCPKTLYNIFT